METLGGYDAGGRTERGDEEAREQLTRITMLVPCSPFYVRGPNGKQEYSHINPALSGKTSLS